MQILRSIIIKTVGLKPVIYTYSETNTIRKGNSNVEVFCVFRFLLIMDNETIGLEDDLQARHTTNLAFLYQVLSGRESSLTPLTGSSTAVNF